jgi:hypothetical protein
LISQRDHYERFIKFEDLRVGDPPTRDQRDSSRYDYFT